MPKKSGKTNDKSGTPAETDPEKLKAAEEEAKGGADGDALLKAQATELKKKEKVLEAPSSDGMMSKPTDKEVTPPSASSALLPTPITVPPEGDEIPAASSLSEVEAEAPSASLTSMRVSKPIKIVKSWPSSIDLGMKPRDFTFYSMSKLKFRHFTDHLDFLLARDELAKQMVDMYDGVVQDVNKTYMGIDQRSKVTDPDSMGFNLLRLKETNSHQLRGDMYDTLANLTIGHISPTEETMFYVGRPWEHELLAINNAEWRKNLHLLTDIHLVLKQALDTTEYYVAPLAEEVQRVADDYLVDWEPITYGVLKTFLDENRVLQGLWVDIASRVLMETMEVSATRESVTMSDLRKTLQLSVNVSNGLNDIVQVIDAQKAVRMFYMILKSKLFNRFYALEVQAALDTFSWTTVIEFILMKLMLPAHALTERAKCRINNYLLVHLFANLDSGFTNGGQQRGQQRNRVLRYQLPTHRDFDTVDYVALARNAGAGQLPPEYSAFMDSWADGGNPQTEMFAAQAPLRADGTPAGLSAAALIGRTTAFKPWGGRVFPDWDHMTDQMYNFVLFNQKLQQDVFYAGITRGSERPITRMASFFVMKLSHLQMLMFTVNKMLRLLSANALVMNDDRDPTIEDGCRIDQIPTGGVISMFTLLVPRTFHIRPPDLRMLMAGLGAFKTLRDLVEAYYLALDARPKRSYYKNEVIDAAFKSVDNSTPFMNVMKMVLLGYPEKYYMKFPDRAFLGPAIRSRHYSMMLAARSVIDRFPEEFGYVRHFFRLPRQIRQARQQVHGAMYEYYYVNQDIPDDMIYATVNLSQLIDHLRNETFNQLEEDASARGMYIKFNIPTTFKLVEGPPQDNAGRAPFTHVNGLNASEKLEIMEIPIYHQWMEDFISGRITTQNTSRPPFYQVPATSLRISPERELLASARRYIAYRKGVQFVEVDNFIRFVRKSDI